MGTSPLHSAMRIIVADDDVAILDSMKLMLEMDGYTVETIEDGTKVSDAADSKPDLLLLDVWMSGQDGRDICRSLKAQTSTAAIPIIMISAGRDMRESVFAAGANDFITKPFEMSELLEKVSRYTS